ncbi:Serine/threonine-protein kinase CTR1 [Capsicum baccatum]|uniref:Serine/threonine-protein kinase CTR1 n=1 Tax=Capsicum baccatum TaxID=33114 RepID=A0A2G2VU51_CAPBA|nr:Serine/threonine-protein kinase CTR1 [Capsicum baccatum]
MEVPGGRSNYSYTTRLQASIGLAMQSSESSFVENSISGEYYIPSFGHLNANSGGGGGGSLSKSWAQQTEESYQLQLTLSLRISSEATCADDSSLLDHVVDQSVSRASVEAKSHRFWVNGSLSYFDKVPDGFYLIQGMDPYVWTVCSDLQEGGRIPSIESLKAVDPSVVPSVEVILIDRRSDPSLKELQNQIHGMSPSCNTTNEVVDQLAKLVCNHMGGAASGEEGDFVPIWKECCNDLKDCLGSIVFPIGSLSVGLCGHRTLLFKVLADSIDLPCRIARGCRYCKRPDAFSCLVRLGLDREYLVDLIREPGYLSEPNSLLNGLSSISISSPLRLPKFGQVEPAMDFTSLAKQNFSDCLSLNMVFDDSSAGTAVDGDAGQTDRSSMDRSSAIPSASYRDEVSRLPLPPINAWKKGCNEGSQLPALCQPPNISISMSQEKDLIPLKNVTPIRYRDAQLMAISDARTDTINDKKYFEGGGRLAPAKLSRELVLDVEDLDIPWNDLVLKERIGAGSFGTVHRADWNGSTFRSSVAKTQIDFLLLRKGDRAICRDCKVIPSENLSTQHRLLVMDLVINKGRKKRSVEARSKIKWGSLTLATALEMREKLKSRGLGRIEGMWIACGRRLPDALGRPPERRWVCREVNLASIEGTGGGTKRLRGRWRLRSWFMLSWLRERMMRRETNKEEYKATRREAKLSIMTAKTITFESLYTALEEKGGDKKLYRLVKARERRARDLDQVKCIKGEDGTVLVEDALIRKR